FYPPRRLTNIEPTCTFSFFLLSYRPTPLLTLFPYTTLSDLPDRRTPSGACSGDCIPGGVERERDASVVLRPLFGRHPVDHQRHQDRKSTRLNSSHVAISYAVFCLKKKKY